MEQKSNKTFTGSQKTSKTDVLFLLLVFFMLTSTLISVNAMKLIFTDSPGIEVKASNKQSSITVSIDGHLNYYVDQQQVALEEIKGVLQDRLSTVEEPSIVLNVEKTVPVDQIVQLMNIGHELKADMVLATHLPQ